MGSARTIAFTVHLIALSAGVFLAIAATHSALENLPRDHADVALSRFATAGVLVGVTAAFCIALVTRGFTSSAPLMFVISYALVGLSVSANTRAMAKQFAPAAPEELPTLYATASFQVLIALTIAAAAWLWTYCRSRYPLTDLWR